MISSLIGLMVCCVCAGFALFPILVSIFPNNRKINTIDVLILILQIYLAVSQYNTVLNVIETKYTKNVIVAEKSELKNE